RELLRTPPVAGRKLAAASHASALLALKFDAMPDDAPFIAAMLESGPEGELLYDALNVAGEIFNQSDAPDARLVAAVAAIATDHEADYEDRREALGALVEVVEPAVTALFAAIATGGDTTRLRQHAAWQLASGRHFYGHRPLLERLDADWPAGEPGWPASEITEALAPGPHSIHWAEHEPDLPADLAAALGEQSSPTTEDAHLAAFRRMLHSGHPAASAIALDHFHMDDGLDRFGLDTSPHAAEARAVALETLTRQGDEREHASALRVLEALAEPDDAGAVARVLRDTATTPLVRERATRAASEILEESDEASPELLDALDALVFDTSADIAARRLAVIALFDVHDPRATALLVRAAAAPETEIQVEAAIGLSHAHLVDRHLDLLRALVATWPKGDDEPDRAWLVELPE
ncbi:MAG TPA: hypothetical protein VGF17_28195, partial [Phytomonospora sp.]